MDEQFDWNDCDVSTTPKRLIPHPPPSSPDSPPDVNVLKIIRRTTAASSHREFFRSRFHASSMSYSSRVISILHHPHSERSLDDVSFLKLFCSQCKLFNQFLHNEIEHLLKTTDIVACKSGDRIFTAGDPCGPDTTEPFAYVIVDGTVTVCAQTNLDVNTTAINEYLEQSKAWISPIESGFTLEGEYCIANLGSCCSFGAQAASVPTRGFSVLCSDDCQLMRIPASSFSEAVEHHRIKNRKEIMEVIQSAPFLNNLELVDLNRLANTAQLKSYKRNQIVFRQGTPTTGVAIVKTGTFRLLQKRDQQIIEVAQLAKGEAWGYKSLMRRHTHEHAGIGKKKTKFKRNDRSAAHHWKKLSTSVRVSNDTTMIAHSSESDCELVFIPAIEWHHVVMHNDELRAALQFAILLDQKKTDLEEEAVSKELKVNENADKELAAHVDTHAQRYRERHTHQTKMEKHWWKQVDAAVFVERHMEKLRLDQRRALNLPDLPHWARAKASSEPNPFHQSPNEHWLKMTSSPSKLKSKTGRF